MSRKKKGGTPRTGRPVKPRTPDTLRAEIQSLSRLRTAILIDTRIDPERQNRLGEMIDELSRELAGFLRSQEACAAA